MDAKGILLVEDNPNDTLLTLRAFEKIGVKEGVTAVADGAQALDYLFGTGRFAGRSPLTPPRAVLLDLSLPGLNGIEVLDRIRADDRTRHVPVVVFSASDDLAVRIASYRNGANSFVRKPHDFPQFTEALRQVWHYWCGLNEPAP